MGPYDNETGKYLFDSDIMSAHWVYHDDSESLYIVGRDEHGFEGYGNDDDIEEVLLHSRTAS